MLDQWLGLFLPAGAPDEVVRRLNAEVDKVLTLPAVRERYETNALEVVGGGPEQFAKLYRDDFDKYGRLVKELNISIN